MTGGRLSCNSLLSRSNPIDTVGSRPVLGSSPFNEASGVVVIRVRFNYHCGTVIVMSNESLFRLVCGEMSPNCPCLTLPHSLRPVSGQTTNENDICDSADRYSLHGRD